jgi:TPR repeat protein
MKLLVHIAFIGAFALPTWSFAASELPNAGLVVAAAPDNASASHDTVVGAAEADSAVSDLQAAARRGDAKAQVALGVKYAFAEGVPKDQQKSNQLFCQAAKYGHADGLYNFGWAFANATTAWLQRCSAWLRIAATNTRPSC